VFIADGVLEQNKDLFLKADLAHDVENSIVEGN
jgi:hypothetical protein